MGKKLSWPDLRYYDDIYLEELRKSAEILNQDTSLQTESLIWTSRIRSMSAPHSTLTNRTVFSNHQ